MLCEKGHDGEKEAVADRIFMEKYSEKKLCYRTVTKRKGQSSNAKRGKALFCPTAKSFCTTTNDGSPFWLVAKPWMAQSNGFFCITCFYFLALKGCLRIHEYIQASIYWTNIAASASPLELGFSATFLSPPHA